MFCNFNYKNEVKIMMYPFMTLEDNTEVVHSEAFVVDGKEMVKVYIEKPVNHVYLP